jgi:hypothetical protein
MTEWGFPNFDRHLDPDLYDPLPESETTHTKTFTCRGCGHHGAESEFGWFNGFAWCRETCHKEITALFLKSYPNPVTEDEAVEHFKQVRR